MSDRRRISSGSRWEAAYGYSRAVVDGDRCWVAGTTDPSDTPSGDAAAQAHAAVGVIEHALAEAGFSLADVVRTRMYVTRPEDAAVVTAVHREVFGEIRPAATLVIVAALIEPGLLVEIEVDAVRSRRRVVEEP